MWKVALLCCMALYIKLHLKPCWSQQKTNACFPRRRLFLLFFFHRADTIAIHLKIIVAQIYRGTHRLSNLVTLLSTKVHMCKQLKKKTSQSWWECPATPSKKQHKLHPTPTSTVRLRLTHFNPSPQDLSSASTNSPGSSQSFLLYFT